MEVIDLEGKEFTKENVAQLMRILRRDGEVSIVNGHLPDDRQSQIRILNTKETLIARLKISPKERSIISCIAQGYRNKEIAALLNTSEQVIKNHLRVIYDKTGVSSRVELANYVHNNDLLKFIPEGGVPSQNLQK